MKSQLNNIRMGGLCALVAVLALGSSGCLALVAGTAGGVAAYAYVKGKVDESYTASFGDTWAATHAAMRDLGMPVLKEENTTTKGAIESKNAEGEKVHIQVEAKSGNKPADGTTTRVDVRVATFGDRRYSDHFLNQIGRTQQLFQ